MAEVGADIQSIGIFAKDIPQISEQIKVFHVSPKENVKNILEKGLIAGERMADSELRKKGNALVDMYCRIFNIPVNRSSSVYALLDDPRIIDADNIPYESDKHAIIEITADKRDMYIGNTYHYEGVLAELEPGGNILKAHVEAIKYARSITQYDDYKKRGDRTKWDGFWQKPEVLIPQKVSPLKLKIISQ